MHKIWDILQEQDMLTHIKEVGDPRQRIDKEYH